MFEVTGYAKVCVSFNMVDLRLGKHEADDPTKQEEEDDSMKGQKVKKKPYALQLSLIHI